MSSLNMGTRTVRADATRALAIGGTAIAVCGLLAVAIAVGADNCSAWFAIPGLCRWPSGLAIAIGVAALPLLALAIARRPLAALLAIYIVLVPIDDALLIGRGLAILKIVGIAIAITALARIVRRRSQIRLPHAVFGWMAVIGFMALSIIWSIDPRSSAEDFFTISSAFGLLLVLVAVPMDAADYRAVIFATIASGAVAGVIAIILAPQELSAIAGQVGRLYLTFGTATLDPNRFGASLLAPVAITVGAFGQTGRWGRIWLLAALALTCTAVYLSASRGTMLALIAMAIVGILATRHRVVLGSLLVLGVALSLVIPSEITLRLFAESTAANGTGRLDIWHVALQVFRAHWLLGTGVGTFPSAYDRAFFLAYEPQFSGWHADPHSLLTSTATELGLVGIAIMAVALILQYRSVRLIGADHPYPWLRSAFSAAFIGLLIAALFVDVLATKFSWLLFTEMLIFASIAGRRQAPTRAQALALEERG